MSVPSIPMMLESQRASTVQNKRQRITKEPVFKNSNSNNNISNINNNCVKLVNLVAVKVTHFNSQQFNGFVSYEDGKHQIYQSTGMEISSHHGAIFSRVRSSYSSRVDQGKKNEDELDELFITFRIKIDVEKEILKKYFW